MFKCSQIWLSRPQIFPLLQFISLDGRQKGVRLRDQQRKKVLCFYIRFMTVGNLSYELTSEGFFLSVQPLYSLQQLHRLEQESLFMLLLSLNTGFRFVLFKRAVNLYFEMTFLTLNFCVHLESEKEHGR